VFRTVAKDTEKLIRQLSLISYLMAERRPVTATEIRRDVEGYSDMTEDAFARRFYADRAELADLGIHLRVDRPAEGVSEQEHYSLAREAFFLPAIAFTDRELASLQTALSLLDGEFAYAEPLRLALQQISWGRPSPLGSPAQRAVGLGITASAGGAELSARLAKIDTAIYRRKRIEFEYYTMQSGETALRRVDPYQLLFEAGQFYLVGHSHERGAVRVFRLSRIQGKVAYATKAEHDFQRPPEFDPREYANRIPWQLGEALDTAEIWISERIAWHVERTFGPYGSFSDAEDSGRVFRTEYAIPRLLVAWALGYGEHVRILGPPGLREEAHRRLERVAELHRGEPFAAVPIDAPRPEPALEPAAPAGGGGRGRPSDGTIRPERFARLVTLASVLIDAGRRGERPRVEDVCARLQMTPQELREDISVLNVVNFGGGAYVLYAEVLPTGEIEVDPEPYSDTFDRPARLLPIEAKALVAAIDLLGSHVPEGALDSARAKIVAALGHDPVEEGLHITSAAGDDSEIAQVVGEAIARRRKLEVEYYAANEDRFSLREIEPYALINGREGWYVAAWDASRDDVRHFRLDRIKRAEVLEAGYEPRPDLDPVADVEGWPRTGEVGGSRTAHVWISPEQARWAREERTVLAELPDGAIIVEWAFKGDDYLVKEVLKEAGDAAVLAPADVREAVLAAAERLLVASAPGPPHAAVPAAGR
jgi:proteasome accessory factor C